MQSGTRGAPLGVAPIAMSRFCFAGNQIKALPVDNQFVCNEFCAQALREEAEFTVPRALLTVPAVGSSDHPHMARRIAEIM